jgi:hypothetical protein
MNLVKKRDEKATKLKIGMKEAKKKKQQERMKLLGSICSTVREN